MYGFVLLYVIMDRHGPRDYTDISSISVSEPESAFVDMSVSGLAQNKENSEKVLPSPSPAYRSVDRYQSSRDLPHPILEKVPVPLTVTCPLAAASPVLSLTFLGLLSHKVTLGRGSDILGVRQRRRCTDPVILVWIPEALMRNAVMTAMNQSIQRDPRKTASSDHEQNHRTTKVRHQVMPTRP